MAAPLASRTVVYVAASICVVPIARRARSELAAKPTTVSEPVSQGRGEEGRAAGYHWTGFGL
jgi:hypothetical protein